MDTYTSGRGAAMPPTSEPEKVIRPALPAPQPISDAALRDLVKLVGIDRVLDAAVAVERNT
jgi:hypothetical protein